jgi:quinoprotein glucose dehydrogenase
MILSLLSNPFHYGIMFPRLYVFESLLFFSCFASLSISVSAEKPPAAVPQLREASSEPQAAIPSFKKPMGWSCGVFASEPMMGNPVAIAIDPLGRVLVCESYRQNQGVTDNRGHDDEWLDADLAAMTVQDRINYHRRLLGDKAIEYETQDDLLRLLVDTDGDFVADKATVFASGFNSLEEGTGAGALFRDNKVYFTNIPKLWSLTDKDRDGVADDRVVLSDGYGVRVAFRGHDMHGLIMGPEGRLYFSIGDRGYHIQTPKGLLADPESGAVFRCELDGSNLEVVATGLRNPQELAFDDDGNLFTGDNNSDSGDKARWVQIVRGGDSGWRMMYQYISDRGPFNREKIWYPFSADSPAYIVPPIANIADGPSGLLCYPGTGLSKPESQPNLYQNAFFLCDFRGQASNSGIRLIKVKPKGAFFEVETNEELVWNILATDAEFGPDGGLYVSDWINGWNGENKGRVYRFADIEAQSSSIVKQTAALLSNGMQSHNTTQLLELLNHPDRRVRFESQWELANRSEVEGLSRALKQIDAPKLKKLHAVWGLGQILRKNPQDKQPAAALIAALGASDPIVTARAIEMLSEANYDFLGPHWDKLASHASSVVKAAACMAAGKARYDFAMPAVLSILENNNNEDPILRHAGIMALAGFQDRPKVISLKTHLSEAIRLAAVVALRKAKNPRVAEFLSDASPNVVKEAARAIHDVVELHSALPALAAIKMIEGMDQQLVHRVLNANFRMGQPENAFAIAEYAADRRGLESMRIEALEMLATWSSPGNRDRVMNRHLPLAGRSSDAVNAALTQHMESLSEASDKIRDRFMEVGAALGVSELAIILAKAFEDQTQSGARRAVALKGLNQLDPSKAEKKIELGLRDPELQVRLTSLQLYSDAAKEKSIPSLALAIKSDSSKERQLGWDLLGKLSSPEAIALLKSGAEAYLESKLAPDSRLNVAEAVDGKLTGDIKSKWDAHIATLDSLRESQPQKYYADCIEGGDVQAGKNLFFTRASLSCVRCHRVGKTGGEVGPELGKLGTTKDRAYLLEAIVAPNITVAQGFETVIIADSDGNTVTGILKAEDDEKVQIMDSQGAMITVKKEDIEGRKKGLSSMPSDLMKYMNQRELRDLVAYLSSLDGSKAAMLGLNESTESSDSGHKVK